MKLLEAKYSKIRHVVKTFFLAIVLLVVVLS